MAYDTDAIRQQNPLSEILPARHGITLKRNGREFAGLCPFHSEKTPSFQVYVGSGGSQRYHCKGCQAEGDVIDFTMQWNNVDFAEACAILGGERDADPSARPAQIAVKHFDHYAGFTYGMPPANAPLIEAGKRTPKVRNPKDEQEENRSPEFKDYVPSMVFPYRTREGALIGYVIRQDLPNGRKNTPAIWWMEFEGWAGWCHGSYPEPRPLYGLDQLATNADWQVVVVEGEKAADALRRMLNVCVVSWIGGAAAYDKADWSPLAGRHVILWGDADQQGEDAMIGCVRRDAWKPGIAELIHAHGPASLRVAPWDKTKPKGWDAADAAAGIMTDKETGEIQWQSETGPWTKREVAAWIQARADAWAPKPAATVTPLPEKPKPVAPKAEPVQEARPTQQAKPSPQEVERGELERKRQQKNKEAEERRKKREEEEREAAWKAKLIYGKEEKLAPKSQMNAQLLLEHHPDFRGVFVYDEFANRVMIARRPPWDESEGPWEIRPRNDIDTSRTRAYLERLGIVIGQDDTGRAANTAADAIKVSPLRDYLHSLKWDGVPRLAGEDEDAGSDRIAGWLTTYLGAEDTFINRAFGKKWMISAVARALQPASKVDTMLILEGAQGLRKSTALRALGTVGKNVYYTDEIADIGSKDAAQQMQGVWIIELAELNALNRGEVNSIKAWMTRQTDRLRLPYAKELSDLHRSSVFAGTVNPGGIGYLKDETGARRFWPVACSPVVDGAIDIEGLDRDKEQLWAEAVHRFKDGEHWWLDPEEETAAKVVQGERFAEDPWADRMDSYLDARQHARLSEIMTDCLSMAPKEQTPIVEKRVAGHLRARGWTRKKMRLPTETVAKWAYVPPAA